MFFLGAKKEKLNVFEEKVYISAFGLKAPQYQKKISAAYTMCISTAPVVASPVMHQQQT